MSAAFAQRVNANIDFASQPEDRPPGHPFRRPYGNPRAGSLPPSNTYLQFSPLYPQPSQPAGSLLVMAQKASRGEWIKLRVSHGEKVLIEERADAAGLTVSEYIRREAGIGHFGRADLRREARTAVPAGGPPVPELPVAPSFDARVREEARTMPRRNAEIAVRREEARERAQEALASGSS